MQQLHWFPASSGLSSEDYSKSAQAVATCPIVLKDEIADVNSEFTYDLSRVTGVDDKNLWVGDLTKGAIVAQMQLPSVDPTLSFDQIASSPNDRFIALVRTSGPVEIRDRQTLNLVASIPTPGLAMSLAWIDSRHVLIASPAHLTSWNVESKAADLTLDIHENLPLGVHIDPSGTHVIVTDKSNSVGIYSLDIFKCKTIEELRRLVAAKTK